MFKFHKVFLPIENLNNTTSNSTYIILEETHRLK